MGYTVVESERIAGAPQGYPPYYRMVRNTPYQPTSKRKRPRGALALLSSPTPWIHTKATVNSGPSTESTNKGYFKEKPPVYYIGDVRVNDVLPPALRDSMLNQSKMKVLEKIKGTKWNLGTFLGELPETQKWLVGATKEIVSAYRAVKRANWKSLKKQAKRGRAYLRRRGLSEAGYTGAGKAAKRWLEWRYAVCPLVYDLDDMLSALYDSATKPMISRSASGSKGYHQVLRVDDHATHKVVAVTSGEGQNRVVVYYSVNLDAAALKRLGLINLPAVFWELTPLSFVVDWFLPVGDFIGHLDAMAGVKVVSTTSSLKAAGVKVMPGLAYTTTRGTSPNQTVTTITHSAQSAKVESYSRVVLGSLAPSFRFTTSPAGNQLIDLVALMRVLVFK